MDIVERLKLPINLPLASGWRSTGQLESAAQQAADEIISLRARVNELQHHLDTQAAEIERLRAENAQLKDRLGGKWVPWDERVPLDDEQKAQK